MTARIGFVGLGNMGAAMVRGLRGVEIFGTDLHQGSVDALAKDCGLIPAADALELADRCEYVVLAVKPQHARSVCKNLAPALGQGKTLISICAGIPAERIKRWVDGSCPVIRVMPNTPALVGEGVFAVCLDDPELTEAQKSFVTESFKGLGQVHVLAEKDFDAFTAVIGSGPAYVFYFMEACVESAVALGLPRPMATEMVKGLFSGSAKLAAQSPKHLSELREMVTSPAGTTIQALIHMDRTAMRGNIIDAIRESYERSIELGQ
ncbi:MAG: pyrroline-5-carboxylate reductase [Desulfovibrionaceae bacterium]